MSNVSAIATKNYISLVIDMGEEGSMGCHLPRIDAFSFAKMARAVIESHEAFPEMEFETDTMLIEGMGANVNFMFCFTNKSTGKQCQFAMETDDCLELIRVLESVVTSSKKLHGQPDDDRSRPWKFFSCRKAS